MLVEECFSVQHNTKQHSDQELQIISISARFVTEFHDITTLGIFASNLWW